MASKKKKVAEDEARRLRIEKNTASHPGTIKYFFEKAAATTSISASPTTAAATAATNSRVHERIESDDGGLDEESQGDEEDEAQAIANKGPSAQQQANLDRIELLARTDIDPEALKTTEPRKIYGDPNLTAIQKMEKILTTEGVASTVTPIGELYNKNVEALANLTPRIKYVVRRRTQAANPANLKYKYEAGDPWMKCRKAKGHDDAYNIELLHAGKTIHDVAIHFSIPFPLVSGIDLEKPSTLRKFANALCLIANAWPYAMPGVRDDRLRRVMIDAALRTILAGQLPVVAPHTDKHFGLELLLPIINEVTGQPEYAIVRSKQGFLAKEPLVIPNNVDLYTSVKIRTIDYIPKTIVNGVATWESLIPDDIFSFEAYSYNPKRPTLAALKGREHFMRFCSYKLSGMISTGDKIRRIVDHMEVVYGVGFTTPISKRLPAIPNFAIILPDSSRPGTLFVRVSATVCQQLSIDSDAHGFSMAINTTDGRRLARIMEVTQETLAVDFDCLKALRVLAQEIDKTHAAIAAALPPPPSCTCDPDKRDETTHACTVCCNVYRCSDLFIGQSGVRKCLSCDPDAHIPFKEDVVERLLRKGVDRALKLEWKNYGKDTTSQQFIDIREEVTAAVLARQHPLGTGHYKDEYLQATVTHNAGHNPFVPSIEAVHSLGRREADGLILRHTIDNTIVTGWGLNIWHKNHPIGAIQEALTYARSSKTPADVERLVTRLDDMMGIPRPLNDGRRKQVFLSKDEYDLHRYQYLTGRPINSLSEQQKKNKYRHMLVAQARGWRIPRCQWTPRQQQLIIDICYQIESKYSGTGTTLSFAPDGAIWPTQWGVMPSYWNWDVCYAWSSEHLITWRDHCNRPWDTAEDESTIWLETIRQLNDVDRLKKLRLGLPQRPWRNQMLSPSFGKIPGNHAVQMLTGWTLAARSLNDWHSSRCSVILMTWSDNLIDFNWTTPHLARMKELYVDGSWNIPLEWYNPDAPLPDHLKGKVLGHLEQEEDYLSDDDEYGIGTLDPAVAAKAHLDPIHDTAIGRLFRTALEPATPHLAQESAAIQGPVAAARTVTTTMSWPYATTINKIIETYATKFGIEQTEVVKRPDASSIAGHILLPGMRDLNAYPPPTSDQDSLSAFIASDMLMPAFKTLKYTAAIPRHIYVVDIETTQYFLGNVHDPANDLDSTIQLHIKNNLDTTQQGAAFWPAQDMAQDCTEVHTIINDHGSHYIHVALRVDTITRRGTIIVRDSLPGKDPRSWLLKFSELFTKRPGSPWANCVFVERVQSADCPVQPDLYNCGVFSFASMRATITGTNIGLTPGPEAAREYGHQLRIELLGNVYELATNRSFNELLTAPQQAALGFVTGSLVTGSADAISAILNPSQAEATDIPPAVDTSSPSQHDTIIKPVVASETDVVKSKGPEESTPSEETTALEEITAPDSDVVDTAGADTTGRTTGAPTGDGTDSRPLAIERILEFGSLAGTWLYQAVINKRGEKEDRQDLIAWYSKFTTDMWAFHSVMDASITFDEASQSFSCHGQVFDPVTGYNRLGEFGENHGVNLNGLYPYWAT